MKHEQVYPRADRLQSQSAAQVEAGQGAALAPAMPVNAQAPMACPVWVYAPFPAVYPVVALPFAWAWAYQLQWTAFQASRQTARDEAEQAARRNRWLRRWVPSMN